MVSVGHLLSLSYSRMPYSLKETAPPESVGDLTKPVGASSRLGLFVRMGIVAGVVSLEAMGFSIWLDGTALRKEVGLAGLVGNLAVPGLRFAVVFTAAQN